MIANPRGGRSAALFNARWMASSQVLGMGLRLAYVVAAARLLGAERYGLLAYAQSWYIAVMPLALLGISIQMGRALGASPAQGLAFAQATRGWRIAVAVAATGVVTLLAAAVEPVSAQVLVIGVFALTLVPRIAAVGSEAVLTGLERADQTFANHLRWRMTELAAAVLVMLAGGGLLALAVLHLASWSAQALDARRRERRLARAWPVSGRLERATALLFRDGLPIALAAAVNGLLISGLLILYRLLAGASDALGAVALCLQVVGMLLGLAVALGNALLPHLARRGRRVDDPLPRQILTLGLALASLGAALGLALGGPWLPGLLGAGFDPVAHWLPLLAVFAGLILSETLLARLLVVHGGAARLLPIAVAAIGLALPAASMLIPALGGLGALIAALLGYAAQTTLTALAITTSLGLPRRGLLAPALGLGMTGLLVLTAPAAPLAASGTLLLVAVAALSAVRGRTGVGR